MTVEIELGVGERVVIGRAVLINPDGATRLIVEGDAPVLREADLISPEEADSPAKRMYLAVQTLYLTRDPARFQSEFMRSTKELIQENPHASPLVANISKEILIGSFYKALAAARALVVQSGDSSPHAKRSASLCADRSGHGQSA
jgi:flagellar protein FlbT